MLLAAGSSNRRQAIGDALKSGGKRYWTPGFFRSSGDGTGWSLDSAGRPPLSSVAGGAWPLGSTSAPHGACPTRANNQSGVFGLEREQAAWTHCHREPRRSDVECVSAQEQLEVSFGCRHVPDVSLA